VSEPITIGHRTGLDVVSDVERETREMLERAVGRLAAVRAPGDVVHDLEALSRQVGEPCVVAVVGAVKA
jgi:hypothetical protein